MILVSLKDAKANTWSWPKWANNKATALRELSALVNDRQATLLSSSPADFDLFQVGCGSEPFDGKVVPCTPIHLANGVDVKQSAAPME